MALEDLFSGPGPRRRSAGQGIDSLFASDEGEGGYRDRARSRTGGLSPMARTLGAKGRDGDSLVAHINPQEASALKAMGGRGTVNPKTGMLEFAPGELQYNDGIYTMSDGSALPWDTGEAANDPNASGGNRQPRAMSGNSEAGDSSAYAARGSGGGAQGGSVYDTLYGHVAANPAGGIAGMASDAISQDRSQQNAYGQDWAQATGWTDADYARRASEMEANPTPSLGDREAAADRRDRASEAANTEHSANSAALSAAGRGQSPGAAPAGNVVGTGVNGQVQGTDVAEKNPDGSFTWPGGYTKGPLVDPYTEGKSVYQSNPGVEGAPPAYAWGTAPGGMLPAGAYPETFMDPITGVTTYNAAPPPNANGQWLNPQFLPWDVRNGGTGDPYVPWTPEWAADQAVNNSNGYAFQALVASGADPAKYIPGYTPAMAARLARGNNDTGTKQRTLNKITDGAGGMFQIFQDTESGIYMTSEGFVLEPLGNGLFWDTAYGIYRAQDGTIVDQNGTPLPRNDGVGGSTAHATLVLGDEPAHQALGPLWRADLGGVRGGNLTPVYGAFARSASPTTIDRQYIFARNPYAPGGAYIDVGAGSASRNRGQGGGNNTPPPPPPPTSPPPPPPPPAPVGGAGAPVNVPYIPAPNRRGGYASGFGLDDLFI